MWHEAAHKGLEWDGDVAKCAGRLVAVFAVALEPLAQRWRQLSPDFL